jgi:hypothetical protein
MIRKAVGTVVFIFILAWVMRDPAAAGTSVHHWIHGALLFMERVS